MSIAVYFNIGFVKCLHLLHKTLGCWSFDNIGPGLLSQASALVVTMTWMSTRRVVFIFSHIKNLWVRHCSAKLKNLSLALLSQAPLMMVTMSQRSSSGMLAPLHEASSSTNQKPWKYEWGTARPSYEIWVLHCSAKLTHYLWQCPDQ